MTCFEHVLFFFIRRPGDLPVLEAAQGGRVSTQYVLSNSRQSNSISLSSHHHPPSFPIWFNRSNSPSVSTLLLSLAPVLLLFIFYPIRGLFDGTMSTTLCSKLIPNIAIYLGPVYPYQLTYGMSLISSILLFQKV